MEINNSFEQDDIFNNNNNGKEDTKMDTQQVNKMIQDF